MANFRIDRISEEVRREIDKILREDVHDPRITGTYCITRADVTRDLKYAKVYISILENELAADMMKALKSAAGFIRRELGRKAQLRSTPEVIFIRDENIAYGAHIAEILKNVSGTAVKLLKAKTKAMNGIYDQLAAAIRNAGTIMICTHVRPDGDAVGALIGVGTSIARYG